MRSGSAADLVAPSWEWVPPAPVTEPGAEAVAIAELAGLVLDPWQAYALDRILAEDGDERPVAFEAAVIVPRQNGKGALLEALSLYWLFVAEVPLVLHSAHEFKTASEAFARLQGLLRATPALWNRVERVWTGKGSEAITTHRGQRLRYVARSKGSGRGFTAGKVILDEAYALSAQEMAALLPTMATQPGAQLVYTSSAGMATSDHLRMVRDRGRRGGDPSLAWLEWGGRVCCPEGCHHELDDEACGLNDRAQWCAANPGVGIRISEDYVTKERRSMAPAEFARERLGVWDEPVGLAPVDLAAWSSLADPGSRPTGRPVLGLDVSPGLRSAAIVAAGRRADGAAHVEVLEYRAGTDWVAPWLAASTVARGAAVYVLAGSGSPAAALMPGLKRVRTVEVSSGGYAAACDSVQRLVDDRGVRHLGSPVLAAALAGAVRRDVGDGGWVMSRKKSGPDISPAVAMVLALWGLASAPPTPSFRAI